MNSKLVAAVFAGMLTGAIILAAAPLQISGMYPSLATFKSEGECGTA